MAGSKPDPISQFKVEPWAELNLFGLDLTITNASFFVLMAGVFVASFFALASRQGQLVPNRLQSLGEVSYDFISGMIRSTAGEDALKFFPIIFTLFFFILFANLIGMVPYFFTSTSHIVVTGTLALAVFAFVTILGVVKNGFGFLRLFAPAGVPGPIYILLVPIEIISYFARPLTLSFRLFANMLAGHIMLKLLAGFSVMMAGAGGAVLAFSWLPLVIAVAITALEFLVAFLQAYVFAILTCVYLSDALHPGHH